MLRKWNGWVRCLAVAALAATVGHLHVHAEVSADLSPNGVSMIVLGIIEGPDPIPQIIWEPVREVDPRLYLNPDGAARGDGRPDAASDPMTGWPHVVWAWNNGTDHDIAYSRWTGDGWLETEFLTSGMSDEIDPRIFVDEQTIYVVWWEDGSNKIWVVTRPRDGEWAVSEQVSQALQTGMRPSVVSWAGTVLIAAEGDDGHGGSEIIIATRQAQGGYVTESLGSVSAGDHSLEVVLHTEQGKLWMDWRRSDEEFAYSEFQHGAWGNAATIPWTDDSWLRFEEARLSIRGLVLTP